MRAVISAIPAMYNTILMNGEEEPDSDFDLGILYKIEPAKINNLEN